MSEKTAAKIPEKITEAIRQAESITLLTHIHPDGDALGSILSFADILEAMGKRVMVFLEEPVSELFSFLPGTERANNDIDTVITEARAAGDGHITVALDSGDDRRLGVHMEDLLKLRPFLVIDHHKSHKDYGEFRWVEPGASSTGEMIYELALALDAEISYEAAVNLYVAICTDTGSFRYESTKPRTFRVVAELLERGVKPHEISQNLYDNVSLPRIKLLQQVLSTLAVYDGGQLAFVHVTQEMLEKSGATSHDVEGFINYPRSLGTAKVAVFVKEGTEGTVSVSLRAKGECDVADVAADFGGGGHRNAAGFRFQDKTVDEVHSLVLQKLRLRLKDQAE
ncbi:MULTISPECIES: DHH family phosphoesterase [Desulfosediminicola]|uniref:DHH family phosphoesterase n=1 Tax=Desulfosediminicola TaxID=2886823 RepID=UPI0010AD31BB|nr:bifunctional oligoribonuclease/PAP phosphatase NrnA [Desulfosediminicola ganghwensis]